MRSADANDIYPEHGSSRSAATVEHGGLQTAFELAQARKQEGKIAVQRYTPPKRSAHAKTA